MLYDKNETAFEERIELNDIRFKQKGGIGEYRHTADYEQVLSKHKRQRFMIIAEGSVFIALLFFGLMRVRKVFLNEIKLANQQKNFLLSVTHELKSPISTVKLSLQTLLSRKLEKEKSEKLITNSLADVDRLEKLVENILFAAKIERDEPGFSNEITNVSGIVLLAVDKFSLNKKSIPIVSKVQSNILLNCDANGFTSVINNLLENAIKYSEEGAAIKVSLETENSGVVLRVVDNGIGIPDEEKDRVFEKFYRVGNEEIRRTKGTGLGLYIVKRFVEIYKGNILVSDNLPKGTVFTLQFPVST